MNTIRLSGGRAIASKIEVLLSCGEAYHRTIDNQGFENLENSVYNTLARWELVEASVGHRTASPVPYAGRCTQYT